MDLMLAFLLLGLLLQGIKMLFNYLVSRTEYFDEPAVTATDVDVYLDQLSPIRVNNEAIPRLSVTSRMKGEVPAELVRAEAKEIYMPSPVHQSA